MNLAVNILIVLASLTLLYFAYFKKSDLGKLSIFVIFGSVLLQELLSILKTLDFLDVLSSILSTISTFVIYGEVILLVILLITRLKISNKYIRISMIVLIVLKLIAILGIF